MRASGNDQLNRICLPYIKKTRESGESGFTCNPPERGFHEAKHGKKFLTEDDAVTFLKANKSWGIWLKAKGETGALFFNFTIDGSAR